MNHPTQLFDPLNKAEYALLKASIMDHGVEVPLVFDADTDELLDGHHRKHICEELSIIDYPRVYRRFESEAERTLYIYSLNAGRRHLTKKGFKEAFQAVLQLRKARQLTQEQAAEQLGIRQQRYSELEQEARAAESETIPITDSGKAYNAPAPSEAEASDDTAEPTPEESQAPGPPPPVDQRRTIPDEALPDIFTLRLSGFTVTEIAEKYGVSQPTMSRLLKKIDPRLHYPALGTAGVLPKQMLQMADTLDAMTEEGRQAAVAELEARKDGIVARLLGQEPYRPSKALQDYTDGRKARKAKPSGRWLEALEKYHQTLLSIDADGGPEGFLGRLSAESASHILEVLAEVMAHLRAAEALAQGRLGEEEDSDGKASRLETVER